MQSTYIKEEPHTSENLENNWNNNNDILTTQNSIAFQIKSEPINDEFIISQSLIDQSIKCTNIIKEETDIIGDKELNEKIIHNNDLARNQEYNYCETERTAVEWPSKYKNTYNELKHNNTSGSDISKDHYSNISIGIVSINSKCLKNSNTIILKEAKVVLERMPISKILEFTKSDDSTENVDPDDVNTKLALLCKLYCSQCDKTIDATSIYSASKCRICKKPMSLQCKKCNKLYNYTNGMYYHLMSRCYPRKRYNCSECNFTTTMLISIQRHIRRMHNTNDQSTECPKCHKKLKSLEVLRRHVRYCKEEGRYSCTICPYKSHFRKNFDNHMQSHEMFNTVIKESRSTANDNDIMSDLYSEKISVSKKCEILTNFVRLCPQCNTTFKNNTFSNTRRCNLTYHCHLCKTRLLLQCLKCNRKFNEMHRIKQHLLRKCALKVSYKCPECDHQTVYKPNLKWHIKRCHTSIDPKEFKKCPKCDRTFKIISDLNKHMLHCGIDLYDYYCDHCSFRTKCKKSIRFHVQTHMKNGPVKIKKSTRERKMIKAYCSKCNALRQVVQHSKMLCIKCKNSMMFKCRDCDTKALTRRDIRLHESKKHGYVYHDCPNCDKAFLRLWNLNEHKKICKGNESKEK